MLLDLRPALYGGPGSSVKHDRNRGLKPLIAVAEGEADFIIDISLFATGDREAYGDVEVLYGIEFSTSARGHARHPRDTELDLILSGLL